MAKQFLDLAGLQSIIGQIKTYYSGNAEGTASRVNWASNAVSSKFTNALTTARTFTISGDVISTTSASFNGTENVSFGISIADATTIAHGLLTAADKTKLDSVTPANIIETVNFTAAGATVSTALTADANRAISIDLSNYATKEDISAAINFKGVKSSYSELPTSGNHAGDVWIVTGASADKNAEYIYVADSSTTVHWEELGNTIAFQNYYTKTEVDAKTYDHTHISDWNSTTAYVQNAHHADALTTARTVALSGDVSGSTTFDGSANATINVTIGNGKVTNDMLAGSISQSKISGLEDALDSKVDRLTGDTASAAYGKVAYFDSTTGSISYSSFEATGGAITAGNKGIVDGGTIKTYVDAAISSASSSAQAAINALDYSGSTVGYYVTQVTQENGLISVTREAKAVAVDGSFDGITALVDGDALDSALTGDYYITAISSTALAGLFASYQNS